MLSVRATGFHDAALFDNPSRNYRFMPCESIFHQLVSHTSIVTLRINFSKPVAGFATNLLLIIACDNAGCLRHYFQGENTFLDLEVSLVGLMALKAARSLR